MNHFTSKQYQAQQTYLRKQIMHERIYWLLSAISIFCFAVLLTGCGGSSQQDEQQTKQDLQIEADELFHKLNPTFVGPIVIPDPQAYIIEHAQGQ